MMSSLFAGDLAFRPIQIQKRRLFAKNVLKIYDGLSFDVRTSSLTLFAPLTSEVLAIGSCRNIPGKMTIFGVKCPRFDDFRHPARDTSSIRLIVKRAAEVKFFLPDTKFSQNLRG